MSLIYHEKQVGALCGQHALNNLLQGPYTTVDLLIEIARELDGRERDLMLARGTETAEALRFLAQDSHNIDDSGNFSLDVLREALRRGHGLGLVPASSPSAAARMADPSGEAGFLLNLHSHWLAIRKVDGAFWNLNSLYKEPVRVGAFYLSATLAQLRMEGWSVFLVDGALPPPLQDPSMGSPGDWVISSDIAAAGGGRSRAGDADDSSLEAALAASLATGHRPSAAAHPMPPSAVGVGGEDDGDLARAIALSLQHGRAS